jgi:hypothetical protein
MRMQIDNMNLGLISFTFVKGRIIKFIKTMILCDILNVLLPDAKLMIKV